MNLKTQYSKCSHDQLNFDSVGTVSGNTLTINDGVLTVNLPNNQKSDGNTAIRNAINTLIVSEFGQQPYQIANHVMYCMPSGVIGGIAFAGVYSWYSVYSNQWCHQYSAVQLHEIGHNIGLGHSGEGDTSVNNNQYRDQSGNVSNSFDIFVGTCIILCISLTLLNLTNISLSLNYDRWGFLTVRTILPCASTQRKAGSWGGIQPAPSPLTQSDFVSTREMWLVSLRTRLP